MCSLAKALTGKWSVTVKFSPDEEIPNAPSGSGQRTGVGYGQEVWRSGPGGFTLIDDEDMHTPFGEIFLVGFMWWDSTTKSFHGMECSSQNPHECDVQGSLNRVSIKWDGKRLVIDMEDDVDGKKMVWHEVFSDFTPTSFTQTAESGQAGGPLKRMVTIHATRINAR